MHKFSLRQSDLWWCDTEDCVSEECTDDSRCEDGCVCNVDPCPSCGGGDAENCIVCDELGHVPRFEKELGQEVI